MKHGLRSLLLLSLLTLCRLSLASPEPSPQADAKEEDKAGAGEEPKKADAKKKDPPLAEGLPSARTFRKYLLKTIAEYPTDGTHRYYWPRGKGAKGYTGTTRDLLYRGKTIARGDGQGRCYCCGLTFEVFVRGYQRLCEELKQPFDVAGLSAEQLLTLRRGWYVATPDRSGCQGAIVRSGLGRSVTPSRARKGDFAQLWRRSGSGHSVVFIGWVKEKGKRVAIRYWSTQPATKGIGYHQEPTVGKRGVDVSQSYFVRVGR